ncbi:MAG: hypothetical protein U1G07_02225 [Verrucomicrobiota bacterium]
MKVIQPNCRVQFTAEDIDFIVSVLGKKREDSHCLVQLLADEGTRDLILDDDELFRAMLEHRGCLRVSSHIYFYVLVRHVLREAGIESREVADYVAEVLCEFSRAERARCVVPGGQASVEYLYEMILALEKVDDRDRFCLRAHIGNHSLFLAGVFPDRIRFRAENKGFPDLRYYEALGRANYRVASDHRLAGRYALAPIFSTLADRFEDARQALNDVSQRLFSIETDYSLEALLQKN